MSGSARTVSALTLALKAIDGELDGPAIERARTTIVSALVHENGIFQRAEEARQRKAAGLPRIKATPAMRKEQENSA